MHPIVAEILVAQGLSPDAFKPSPGRPQVLTASVPGGIAVSLWDAIRQQFAETGIWPVIRGDDFDPADDGYDEPPASLADVPAGTVRDLLADRFAAQREILAEIVPGWAELTDLDAAARAVDQAGINAFGGKREGEPDWPTDAPHVSAEGLAFYSTTNSRSGRPYPAVAFSLVETAHPHDVPAHLGFGGWNDAPLPELQVAVLREWATAYGAVPACVTRAVLECFVERPPQTQDAAMRLAAEQWIFCDDIVAQGTQTVRRLAMEIWRSPKWFFWWD